jgi:predicted house-cleaning noncanonical NTP pyrophosphatase (MazG superfamily)
MKVYNKLVRDRIPEIIKSSGSIANTRILDDEEYFKCLLDKLLEEVKEVIEDPSKEELADTLEVIRSIAEHLDHSLEDIEKVRIKKNKSNGSFKKRIYLESTE